VLIAVVLGTLFWGLQQALHVPIDKSLDELREKYPNLNFIQLKDGRIMEYHESGDKNGKPILCIQGTLQTGYSMCKLVHPFFIEHGLRAICPTLPGYGWTSWYEDTVPAYSRDIVELADQLGITKFEAVGGWSGGGLIAASIASELPSRVGQLLLVVAAPPDIYWYDYPMIGHLYLWLAGNTRINELLTHFIVLPILRDNCTNFLLMNTPSEELQLLTEHGNTLQDICVDMIRSVEYCERGYSSLAQRWFVPTLINWNNIAGNYMGSAEPRKVTIVYGEKDALITPKSALKYHENIPGSKLYCFKGAGHMAGMALAEYIGVLWDEEPKIKEGPCEA